MQQPERAAATTAAARERLRAPRGSRPSPLRSPIVFSSSYEGNVRTLPPSSHGASNLETLSSLGQGVPEDAGWKNKKGHLLPSHPSKWRYASLSPPPNTTGALDSIPREAGGSKPGSTWLSPVTCTLPLPQPGPRSAARREPSAARSGAGSVRPQVRSVHFWALQDQQKPEKAPGMRSSDWPTRAWVGEGGGGQERGGRWKI